MRCYLNGNFVHPQRLVEVALDGRGRRCKRVPIPMVGILRGAPLATSTTSCTSQTQSSLCNLGEIPPTELLQRMVVSPDRKRTFEVGSLVVVPRSTTGAVGGFRFGQIIGSISEAGVCASGGGHTYSCWQVKVSPGTSGKIELFPGAFIAKATKLLP